MKKVIDRSLVRNKDNLLYRRWHDMCRRCHRPEATDYARYGGRGITVCAGWRGSFEVFVADMGTADATLQLDRIDNDGGYWCGHCAECVRLRRPANCRWATRVEQVRNRRKTGFLTINGVRRSVPEWAELVGMSNEALYQRLYRGWTPERAVFEPVQPWSRSVA